MDDHHPGGMNYPGEPTIFPPSAIALWHTVSLCILKEHL